MSSYNERQLFNFIQGSDITGESSYDIWKKLNPEGTEEQFLQYLQSGPQGEKGEPGAVYYIAASDTVIKKCADDTLLPESIKFSAYYRLGTDPVHNDYSGRFIIEETINGTEWETKYTSSSDEVFVNYVPSSVDVRLIKCTLYSAGDTATELDTQSIPVLIESLDAITAVLSNAAHVIATDSNGNIENYVGCNTNIKVFNGTVDVTSQCTYEVSESEGLTGTWDLTTYTYTVTDLQADTAYADITATYKETSIVKRFSVSKAKPGKSAFESWLEIEGNEGKTYEDYLESMNTDITDIENIKSDVEELQNHVSNKSNPHEVTKDQIGLENVDNTSDADKPISTATQTALNEKANASDLTSHTSDIDNPHQVTKEQVGLGNVDNTSDADKPISDATQTALDGKAEASDLTSHVSNKSNPHEVTKAQVGLDNVDNTSDADKPISTATQTAIDEVQSNINTHIDDQDNPHKVTKDQVGLSNVDNTSDLNKPVSTEQRTAIDGVQSNLDTHVAKQDNPHEVTKAQVGLGNVDNTSDLSKPVSTATQTAIDDAYANSNAYTDQKIADLINGAPSTLDTLKEIADAMAENDGVVEALNVSIGTKAAQTEVDTHTGNSTIHITASERTNWNDAKTHADSAHAPSNAEANQNAFSNVKVGTTTIAADTTTDTLTIAAGDNVTITPDATNDKITITAKDTVYTHPDSGVTAGTYRSVTVNAQGHVTGGTNPTLPINQGGTGAKTAAAALTNLGLTATATELNHCDGVTSNIQTQLNGKAASDHKHDAVFATNNGHYKAVMQSDGNFVVYDTNDNTAKWSTSYGLQHYNVFATAAELSQCQGVTSNIQEQLNAKADASHTHNTISLVDSEGLGVRVKAENGDLKIYEIMEIATGGTSVGGGSGSGSGGVVIEKAEMEMWSAKEHTHTQLKNSLYTASLNTGGTLSIYSGTNLLWNSNDHKHSELKDSENRNRAVMQSDGNFVLYNDQNEAVWAATSPLSWPSVMNVEAGNVGIAPTAVNQVTSVDITFNRTFTRAPHVVVTPQTSAPNVCFASVSDITTTGCKIHLYRSDKVIGTQVHYIVMAT